MEVLDRGVHLASIFWGTIIVCLVAILVFQAIKSFRGR